MKKVFINLKGIIGMLLFKAICMLATTLFLTTGAWAKTLGCPERWDQSEGMRKVNMSTVEIWSEKSDLKELSNVVCKVRVKDETGRVVFEHQGDTFAMDPISGNDLNTDGLPDIVLVEIKRTADFRYSYFIISHSVNPPLVKEIRNEYGIWFERSKDGRILIVTADDGFNNLPDMIDIYHYDLIIPELRFSLVGRSLKDVSSEIKRPYDDAIRRARAELSQSDINAFRAGKIKDEFDSGLIKGRILTIVLSYLYSGRQREAWEELSNMWPPEDRERIQRVILDARARGSLRLLQGSTVPGER
jgi:hypothetical protein